MRALLVPVAIAWLLLLSGCSSVYYAGMEKMGIPKRDILHKRVERARDAQQDVKQQFGSALERFRATVRVNGGDLEKRYDILRAELERSERRSDALEHRIDELEDVADALFDEWEDELDQYNDRDAPCPHPRRARSRLLS
jgi:flagellar motility protein MotE (MotC chaperone)